MSDNELRRQLLSEYRRAYDDNKDQPFLHTRRHLAEKLQRPYEELAPQVQFLEQNRYLHWKAADIFKLSAKGIRVTHTPEDLVNEFPG